MAEQNDYYFTPTEQRFIDLLSDGLSHTKSEMMQCLWDEHNERPLVAMQMHVSRIRKKLRPKGEDLVCEVSGYRIFYRHVRMLSNPYRS